MSGPPPKDPKLRRRRNKPAGFTLLPYEGRQGDPPPWPIAVDEEWAPQELAVWAELWRTPQAVEWERLGYIRIVARYVRMLVESESPHARANIFGEVRALEDRLGLTPRAMLALRWMTDEPVDDEEEQPGSPTADDPYDDSVFED